MDSFNGRIAVITGGGSGMGRELAIALAAQGCHVAVCDLSPDTMAETAVLARAAAAASDVRISTHECDVADEAAWLVFRDEVAEAHATDHIDLLFNNAGIGGGGSIVADDRAAWERCFAICWGGVYLGVRTFLPLLMASQEAWIVNTSSVNGFWASLGPDRPHTAYSAAKFAVKGFTEALITDLAVHAPHIGVSVVMPGHIGTSIVANSYRHGAHAGAVDAATCEMIDLASALFRDTAPMSAAAAAAVILDGVRARRWRILVGADAHRLDAAVRADPERAYTAGFTDGIFGALDTATSALPDTPG